MIKSIYLRCLIIAGTTAIKVHQESSLKRPSFGAYWLITQAKINQIINLSLIIVERCRSCIWQQLIFPFRFQNYRQEKSNQTSNYIGEFSKRRNQPDDFSSTFSPSTGLVDFSLCSSTSIFSSTLAADSDEGFDPFTPFTLDSTSLFVTTAFCKYKWILNLAKTFKQFYKESKNLFP